MFYSISSSFPCGATHGGQPNKIQSAPIYADVVFSSLAALGLGYAVLSLSGLNLGPFNALTYSIGKEGVGILAKAAGGWLALESVAAISSASKKASRLQKENTLLKAEAAQRSLTPSFTQNDLDQAARMATQTAAPQFSQEKEQLNKQISSLTQKNTQLQTDLSKRPTPEALEKAQKDLAEARQLAAKNAETQNKKIKELQDKIAKLEEDLIEPRSRPTTTAYKLVSDRLTEFEKQNRGLEQARVESCQKLQEYLAENRELKAKIEELSERPTPEALDDARSELETAQKQIQAIQEKNSQLEGQLVQLQAEKKALEQRPLQTTVDSLDLKIKEQNNKIEILQGQNTALVSRNGELEKELQSLADGGSDGTNSGSATDDQNQNSSPQKLNPSSRRFSMSNLAGKLQRKKGTT